METGRTVMTHSGKFHADDVFSAALLKIMDPSVQFIRTAELPKDYEGMAFDIGGGRFDHHQSGAEIRRNGVPYAAFGLLWREYGEQLVGKEEAARFDLEFVQPLDADDNTGCGHPLADAIGAFNPPWDSGKSADDCFHEAVSVAGAILSRKLERIHSVRRAADLVRSALAHAENRVVILPRYAPWKEILIESDAEFVVYPSQRGGYNAQCIPKRHGFPALRLPFPQDWGGRTAEELAAISGISTLNFCHRNGFLISALTKEDAIMACRMVQRASASGKQPQSAE